MARSDSVTARLWQTLRSGGGAELIRDTVRHAHSTNKCSELSHPISTLSRYVPTPSHSSTDLAEPT